MVVMVVVVKKKVLVVIIKGVLVSIVEMMEVYCLMEWSVKGSSGGSFLRNKRMDERRRW